MDWEHFRGLALITLIISLPIYIITGCSEAHDALLNHTRSEDAFSFLSFVICYFMAAILLWAAISLSD